MPLAPSPLAPSPARAGLTVVEVLAALVIVSVGLLGMAGTAALSLRTSTTVTRERRALRRLDLRLAALAAAGCSRAEGGAAIDPGAGVHEEWRIGPVAHGAALVDVSVRWREGAGTRSATHRSAILC